MSIIYSLAAGVTPVNFLKTVPSCFTRKNIFCRTVNTNPSRLKRMGMGLRLLRTQASSQDEDLQTQLSALDASLGLLSGPEDEVGQARAQKRKEMMKNPNESSLLPKNDEVIEFPPLSPQFLLYTGLAMMMVTAVFNILYVLILDPNVMK
mmetsp:Transcript_11141/g.15166  ORF Transcript_11141/g.15166 Transcript_11141/m.15166 type:complete len:150 (-) Transcript_11141:176-625(-)